MKRKALIIGNTRGETGVGVDVKGYLQFLKSDIGGAWEAQEVCVSLDPMRSEILQLLESYRRQGLDYFMLIFAGHGGFSRQYGETVMELSKPNGIAQDLRESETLNIAVRQLNILDCCRSYYDEPMIKRGFEMINAGRVDTSMRMRARMLYDKQLQNSCTGTYSLYACSIGESAEGYSDKGGVFSSALLDMGGFPRGRQVYTVGAAMTHAINVVKSNPYNSQNPAARLPRCLESQEFPWAVKALI